MKKYLNLLLVFVVSLICLVALRQVITASFDAGSTTQSNSIASQNSQLQLNKLDYQKAEHLVFPPKADPKPVKVPEKQQYANNAMVGGFWPSGRPYMNIMRKRSVKEFSYKSEDDVKLNMGTVGDLHLPFQSILFDKSVWLNQSDNAQLLNRASVDKFKPGVYDYKCIHSNQDGTHVYYMPYFKKHEQLLMSIIDSVLGPNMLKHVVRMQFARMADNAKILKHQDVGEWAVSTHRIHVPILVTDETKFQVFMDGGEVINLTLMEGHVFEVNNRVPHGVDNTADKPRIHLVIDASENEKTQFTTLRPGQKCNYGQVFECD